MLKMFFVSVKDLLITMLEQALRIFFNFCDGWKERNRVHSQDAHIQKIEMITNSTIVQMT